ncbi:4'-phosphopantetheinyl transferase superfamily protein [Spirosoma sp. KNUC1025]|uniref:4'-phosphopantetheinyl transferase family protein n=1 Tax=Spirosoma sp. KNUC1025 TaxID=2894082 RepID=UPI0038678F60|nr:4'-phosphopantetheinyl transferase superfamily protein [Spirosoma sp. KNUC1025]
MIGNDIVDLNQARQESNWRRKGFLEKLFTPDEQELIQLASDPDVLVWTLWSMKESVYKLVVRETGQRFYAPKKLICQVSQISSETIQGSVFYQKTYSVRSLITTRYVASVARSATWAHDYNQQIISFDRTDYQHQHDTIRAQLIHHYALRYCVPESAIQIQKDEMGVPNLVLSDSEGMTINQPISLSHHGYYGAFAL